MNGHRTFSVSRKDNSFLDNLYIKIYMEENILNDYENTFMIRYKSSSNIEDIQNKFVIRNNKSIESYYESKDNEINIIINRIVNKNNLEMPTSDYCVYLLHQNDYIRNHTFYSITIKSIKFINFACKSISSNNENVVRLTIKNIKPNQKYIMVALGNIKLNNNGLYHDEYFAYSPLFDPTKLDGYNEDCLNEEDRAHILQLKSENSELNNRLNKKIIENSQLNNQLNETKIENSQLENTIKKKNKEILDLKLKVDNKSTINLILIIIIFIIIVSIGLVIIYKKIKQSNKQIQMILV
jgi:hypothetical protein